MKINSSLLPLKVHYFFFLGAMSPIVPFVMVIVRQLGIPVVVQGSLSFIGFVFTLVAKPIIGAAADGFPKARKIIFICLLIVLYGTMSGICFLPPMYKQIVMAGQSLPPGEKSPGKFRNIDEVQMLFNSPRKGFTEECYISEAWDCMVHCDFNGNRTIVDIKHVELYNRPPIEALTNVSETLLFYKMKGTGETNCDPHQELKFECKGGVYFGKDCPSLLSVGVFWVYLIFFLIGKAAFTTVGSVSNAICLDTVGENGDYGAQRAWGTVGWGIMAPICGLLVDWYSGDSYSKSYTPIIVLVLGLGLLDLTITTTKLRVPRLAKEGNIWKSVGLVMKKPPIVLFLFFAVMNGVFDNIIFYVFILEEDMAKGTIYMKYMKFIQGATLAAQCSTEAPFMWMFSWFHRKMGAVGVMKMVFALHTIRIFILATIGTYGPVWAILFCELLNGPCFGLGYTAIVIQAGNITPPGMSATMQSIVEVCYESLGYSVSALAGGLIYHQYGATGIYYIFSIVAATTFVLYLVAAKHLGLLESKTSKDESSLRKELSHYSPPDSKSTSNESVAAEKENLVTIPGC